MLAPALLARIGVDPPPVGPHSLPSRKEEAMVACFAPSDGGAANMRAAAFFRPSRVRKPRLQAWVGITSRPERDREPFFLVEHGMPFIFWTGALAHFFSCLALLRYFTCCCFRLLTCDRWNNQAMLRRVRTSSRRGARSATPSRRTAATRSAPRSTASSAARPAPSTATHTRMPTSRRALLGTRTLCSTTLRTPRSSSPEPRWLSAA